MSEENKAKQTKPPRFLSLASPRTKAKMPTSRRRRRFESWRFENFGSHLNEMVSVISKFQMRFEKEKFLLFYAILH